MKLKILFFAIAREKAGISEIHLDVDERIKVEELKALLLKKFPSLGNIIDECSFAVNGEVKDGSFLLHDKDEVAVLPPVSGGGAERW